MNSQSDRSDDESDDRDDSEATVTFGDPSNAVSDLPPKEEMDDEDIVYLDLRGEGDWMHPPEDDEGSGYSSLPDDMSEDEIEAEIERIKSRHQQRRETTNADENE